MSDLHLSDEQRERYDRTRALAAEVLAPIAQRGTPGRVNRELVKALGEHGLLRRCFDQAPALELCLTREALARECTEAETAFALQGLGGHPIAGSALREAWIPRIASGDAIAAFALTEPEAGSDVRALSMTAVRDGDGYRLSGEKLWISNAPEADVYTVFARAEEGVTAFAVPGAAAGVSGEHRELLAPHAIGTLRLDNVYVPVEVGGVAEGGVAEGGVAEGGVAEGGVLRAPGEGLRVAMRTLDLFRPSVGAFAVGMARQALDLAIAHAATRRTFGKPLKDHQAVAHRIAEIATRVAAARLLVHQAAAALDAGTPDSALSAMAKLLATETAQEAVDAALQFHGAQGLERGHPLEHLYREVRAPRIYEGATEIQREIIARALFRSVAAG